MFDKKATYTTSDFYALNSPDLTKSFFVDQQIRVNEDVFKDTLFKIAKAVESSPKTGDGLESEAFDLQAEIKNHPDSLFVKCYAIKADEPNDNGDCFSRKELIKATPTFVGVPVFTNHQNSDINQARGKVIHSWWDDDKNGIMIIARVDAVAYPQLARGVREQYVTGCFPGDAPVLMADGTEKCISSVEIGDEVITHLGNKKKVIGTRQKYYSYPLYSIKLECLKQPIICTSYHHLMTYRLQEMCSCGCGKEIGTRQDKRVTASRFNRKFKQGHNPRGVNVDYDPIKKLKAIDLNKEIDFLFEPKILDDSCDNFVTNEEAFLIGLFLAEGSYENRGGEKHSITFNFGIDELYTLTAHCHSLLSQTFIDHRNKPTINSYPEASSSRVCLYGKDVAQWFFERCGEYSDKKKMHPSLLRMGVEKTCYLLAGYIEGDGFNVKGKCYGAATVSTDLASQLRLLYQKIGIRDRYGVYENSGDLGYKPVHKIECGITTANLLRNQLIYKKANMPQVKPAAWFSLTDKTIRRITSIQEIPFNGMVYDLEVEDDHTYCVNHIAVSNTSMGAQVQYSLCSVCHNHAETPDSYCQCIRERKTRTVSAKKQPCKYFDHGPEKECPLCGSTKDDIKKFAYEGKVFEHNYGIRFIENSFVTQAACHDCGVTEVIDPQKFLAKVAVIQASLPRLLKAASEIPLTCTDQQCIKIAGQQELDSLNQALDLLSSVSQSMLNQKEQIDLEFLSDLVKVLADLQTVTDELNEQGYGRLQSPGQPPKEGQPQGQMEQGAPEVTNAVQPVNPTPGGGSKIHSGPAGQVGSVTSPLANTKRILLEKISQNLLPKTKSFNLKPLLLKTNHSILKLASYSLPKKLNLKFHMKNKNFLRDK